MRTLRQYRAIMSLVLVPAALVLTACSSRSDPRLIPSVPTPSPSVQINFDLRSDTTCFTQLTDDQHAALTDYVDQLPVLSEPGKDTICVLRSHGSGTGQHYYLPGDGFEDYALYYRLHTLAQKLAVHGLITGDLDAAHTYSLQHLAGISTDGSVFRPYRRTDQGWGRQPSVIGNLRITDVYYGDIGPIPFAESDTERPPEYTLTPLPVAEDTVALVAGTSLTVLEGLSASERLKAAQPVDPEPIQTNGSPDAAVPGTIPTFGPPASPKAAVTPTPWHTHEPSAAATSEPSPSSTWTPVPSPTNTWSPSPSPTRTPSPSPTSSQARTPISSPSPSSSQDDDDREETPAPAETSDQSESAPSADESAGSDSADATDNSGPKGKARGHKPDKPGKGGNSGKK